MSRVLMASITSMIPALANSGAACFRFSTKVRRASTAGTSLGGMPARQLTRRQPSAVAYSIALITPARNSSSRPGMQAMPRSPAAQSPAGMLCSAWVSPCSFSFSARSSFL